MGKTVTNAYVDVLAAAVLAPYGQLERVSDAAAMPTPNSEIKWEFTSALGVTVHLTIEELEDGDLTNRLLKDAHGAEANTIDLSNAIRILAADNEAALLTPSATLGATISSIELDAEGCEIILTFIADGAGEYHLNVVDDGVQIGNDSITTTTDGAVVTATLTVGAIGDTTPGVTFMIQSTNDFEAGDTYTEQDYDPGTLECEGAWSVSVTLGDPIYIVSSASWDTLMESISVNLGPWIGGRY